MHPMNPTPPDSENASPAAPLPDLVSVDVEDYYHLFIDRPRTWDRYPPRLDRGTRRILDLFDARSVKATFFVLGAAALRSPEVVRDIHARGHEIASHGFGHQLVYRMGRDRFREDARRGKAVLEDMLGIGVRGFRASSFSVTPTTPWFWEILAEEGYAYSSSVHPVRNFLYGSPASVPVRPHHAGCTGVVEIPVVPGRVLGLSVPFSGGFYVRFFPGPVLRALARGVRRSGAAVQWYVHSWEFDPEQPRLPLAPHWKFLRYHRLHATESVMGRILGGRATSTVGAAAARFGDAA